MSGSESGVTGLTPKRLDPLETAMLAISDEGMEASVSFAEVGALSVGTSESFGVDAFRCSSATFHFRPGTHSSRRWPSTRRGIGAETTGRAIVWSAELEQTVHRGALGSFS